MKTIIAAAVLALTSSVFGASIGVVTVRGEVGGRNAELTAAAVKQWTYSGNTVTDLGQLTEYVQQAASVDDVFARLFRERGIRFCVRHKVVAAEGGYTYGIQLTDCKTLETIVSKSVNCENLDSAFRAAVSSIGKDIVAAVAAVPDANIVTAPVKTKAPETLKPQVKKDDFDDAPAAPVKRSETPTVFRKKGEFLEVYDLINRGMEANAYEIMTLAADLPDWEKKVLYTTAMRYPQIPSLLNFFPLPGLGIGSFVQGDIIGGALIIGMQLIGGGVLSLGAWLDSTTYNDIQFYWTGYSWVTMPYPTGYYIKKGFAIGFYITGVTLMVGGIVLSAVLPAVYSLVYNEKLKMLLWGKKQSGLSLIPEITPTFCMNDKESTYGLALTLRF